MSIDLPEEVTEAWSEGYSVVPADMDKRPKVRWKRWQTEEQTEEELAGLGHGSVWGLVTGEKYNLVVLDFDFAHGGEDSLHALGLSPTVQTPGGAHVYVTHPGHPVKNSVRAFPEYPGLDVRGDGGLAWFAGRSKKGVYLPVAWPPRPGTLPKEIADKILPHPQETADRAPVGEWAGAGHGVAEAVRYVRRAAEDIKNAEQGTSNREVNKAAFAIGGLVGAGQVDGEWAYEVLLAAALDRGAGEPEDVISAGIEAGADKPWTFTPDQDEWIPAIAYKVFRQGGVPDPEPFPVEALPSPLDDFARQVARAVSCPLDYAGAGVLPALGVGIGGYVTLEITDSWRESPLLYTAMVGPPSSRKSPALNLVMAPVYTAEAALFEAARRAQGEEEAWREVEPPELAADDATIEAFFGVLERNPRGVILAADELTGWVNGMGQYKSGAGRDRQHWLSIWSRRPIKVKRKTTTSHYIPKPFACVLGGIQPEPLEGLIQGRDDGLLPRILMAQGEHVTPFLDRTVPTVPLATAYDSLWNRVRDEGMTDRVITFTDPGYHAFETWANEHYKSLTKVPPELAGAWGKMDAQAARITLILGMVAGESEIGPETVDRAVSLVRYFQGQAAGLLQRTSSGSPWEKKHAGRTKALGRYIIQNPGTTRSELMAAFPEWAMDSRLLDRLLEPLSDMGVWHG